MSGLQTPARDHVSEEESKSAGERAGAGAVAGRQKTLLLVLIVLVVFSVILTGALILTSKKRVSDSASDDTQVLPKTETVKPYPEADRWLLGTWTGGGHTLVLKERSATYDGKTVSWEYGSKGDGNIAVIVHTQTPLTGHVPEKGKSLTLTIGDKKVIFTR